MYKVEKGTAWSIVKDNQVIMEVTSEHYAQFLCNQLNSGVTLEEINKREYPDKEYMAYCREQNKQMLEDILSD